MIERIIRLSHDLEARAGQVLVQLESGQVHAVDAEVFEALMQKRVVVQPGPEASGHKDRRARGAKREEQLRKKQPDTDPRIAEMRDLLLRGKTIHETARLTGLGVSTVARHRWVMARDGLVGKNGKGGKRSSKAQPTSEEIAQAIARRAAIKEARRKQAARMRAAKAAKAARQDAGLRVAAE